MSKRRTQKKPRKRLTRKTAVAGLTRVGFSTYEARDIVKNGMRGPTITHEPSKPRGRRAASAAPASDDAPKYLGAYRL